MKKIALMLLAIFSLSFVAEQNIEARGGRGGRGGRRWGRRGGFGSIALGFGGPGYYGGYPYGGYYGGYPYGGYGYGGPGFGVSIGI